MLENLNFGNRSSTVEVLKKLLQGKDIEMKSHVNIGQVQVLTQLKWFELNDEHPDVSPFKNMSETVEYYLRLMASLDRKSRGEIIEAISEMKKPDSSDNQIIKQLRK